MMRSPVQHGLHNLPLPYIVHPMEVECLKIDCEAVGTINLETFR